MDTTEKRDQVKCTLCGAEFEPGKNTCGGCPINKDCKTICCPNCGFGFPEETKLSDWLRKILKK